MQHLPAGRVPPTSSPGAPASDTPPHRSATGPGAPGMLCSPRRGGEASGGSQIRGELLGKQVVPRRVMLALCRGCCCRRAREGGTSLIFSLASASPMGPRCGKAMVLPSRQEGPLNLSLLLLVPAFKFFPNEFSQSIFSHANIHRSFSFPSCQSGSKEVGTEPPEPGLLPGGQPGMLRQRARSTCRTVPGFRTSAVRGWFWGWAGGFQPWHVLQGMGYNPSGNFWEPEPPSRLSLNQFCHPPREITALSPALTGGRELPAPADGAAFITEGRVTPKAGSTHSSSRRLGSV